MYVELDQLLSNLRTYGLLTFFFCGLALVSPAMLVDRWSDLGGAAIFVVVYGILAITSYQSAIACARRYVGALSFADSLASANSRD
jgi:hypothetical protein